MKRFSKSWRSLTIGLGQGVNEAASWEPRYDVHAFTRPPNDKHVELVYKAVITQFTGEVRLPICRSS